MLVFSSGCQYAEGICSVSLSPALATFVSLSSHDHYPAATWIHCFFILCHRLQKGCLSDKCAKWQNIPLSKTSVSSIHLWWEKWVITAMVTGDSLESQIRCYEYSSNWRNWAKQKMINSFSIFFLPKYVRTLFEPLVNGTSCVTLTSLVELGSW